MGEQRSERIHEWFGLTYANYLVLPRSLLQSMPDGWQLRLVNCLRELDEAYGHMDWPHYEVKALARSPEFFTPWVTCEQCGGEGSVDAEGEPCDPTAKDAQECPLCGSLGEVEDSEGPRYEMPEEVGYRTDPMPHYNRGRTYVPPHDVEVERYR